MANKKNKKKVVAPSRKRKVQRRISGGVMDVVAKYALGCFGAVGAKFGTPMLVGILPDSISDENKEKIAGAIIFSLPVVVGMVAPKVMASPMAQYASIGFSAYGGLKLAKAFNIIEAIGGYVPYSNTPLLAGNATNFLQQDKKVAFLAGAYSS